MSGGCKTAWTSDGMCCYRLFMDGHFLYLKKSYSAIACQLGLSQISVVTNDKMSLWKLLHLEPFTSHGGAVHKVILHTGPLPTLAACFNSVHMFGLVTFLCCELDCRLVECVDWTVRLFTYLSYIAFNITEIAHNIMFLMLLTSRWQCTRGSLWLMR